MDLLGKIRQDSAAFLASTAAADTPDSRESWISELTVEPEGLAAQADPPPPRRPPAPCDRCADAAAAGAGGSPYFWEDLAGEVHCCECVPIPTRRMARELWQVVWDVERQAAAWQVWVPVRWNPFAHLAAREAAAAVLSDASGVAGGF